MDKSCPVVVLGNNKEIMERQNVSILLCGVCVVRLQHSVLYVDGQKNNNDPRL